MNPLTLAAIAGSLCLPATYSLTREGSIPMSMLVVALLGAAAGVIAQLRQRGGIRPSSLTLAFVVGAMFSEIVTFAYYYLSNGYSDPKLSVGVGVSIIEFFAISVVGGVVLLTSALITQHRMARRTNGRAEASGPEI